MASIDSYKIITKPVGSDMLIGTDMEQETKPVKNFTAQSLIDLIDDGWANYTATWTNEQLLALNTVGGSANPADWPELLPLPPAGKTNIINPKSCYVTIYNTDLNNILTSPSASLFGTNMGLYYDAAYAQQSSFPYFTTNPLASQLYFSFATVLSYNSAIPKVVVSIPYYDGYFPIETVADCSIRVRKTFGEAISGEGYVTMTFRYKII